MKRKPRKKTHSLQRKYGSTLADMKAAWPNLKVGDTITIGRGKAWEQTIRIVEKQK